MSDESTDRRRTPRHDQFDRHGIVSARVRPGHEASVVDISAGGALVETSHRLLPGAAVELRLETSERRAAVRGHVLRCSVSRVASSAVCYRGAIGFDRHLPWFEDADAAGYAVHRGEVRPGGPKRAEATHTIL